MNRLLRVLLLLKVMVMLSLGTSMAWAECTQHDEQASSGQGGYSGLMLAKSESEPGDQGQGGADNDDDSTTDEPDSDDDEGDSQS
ncbi:hypothetical protein LOY55_04025 [Pseudomonas sp. B21-040]|jgi:hypothetical protein|uniref:hypothetical protein n=1 Tax=unclassified Pseudomonas TaxID=196821 RepID=UPI00098507C6|nr:MULTISPECIES: hypothetical protein [unclassified Pseudomonas]OOG12436.1 hypothetical protein BMS17_10090 [Pseudomonas sp. C9]PWK31183.1 hypothetical protein C7534_124100 [Pseudomonas sp. OV226]UVL41282.1 hypothetical protein LOY55_04025 [Pseudomonas sp. B21-040]